jgi:hypothetical protein
VIDLREDAGILAPAIRFEVLEKNINAKRLAPDYKALRMLMGNTQFLGGWALNRNGTQVSAIAIYGGT